MQTAKKKIYTEEELAQMEIRTFVNEGLKSIQNEELLDADEVFDELKARYNDEEV